MAEESDFLRPQTLEEYIGQAALKERLLTRASSAALRGDRLPHTLLIAPPGYGKTSIARIIAREAGVEFLAFVMPLDANILQGIVSGFEGIVFFDELHRLSDHQQEKLLSLLEDGYLQLPNGRRIYNPKLTVIAATTEPNLIIGTLYERFDDVPPFDEYSHDDMVAIVTNMGRKMGITLADTVAADLADAASGNPRMASHLVGMARDLEVSVGAAPPASEVLAACRITKDGLTENHLRYLNVLNSLGGTAGLTLISNHLRLPSDILLELERSLVNKKLVTYSGRGRTLTIPGFEFLRKGAHSG